MDKEEFIKKFNELKKQEILKTRYKELGIISKLVFKGVNEIIFITLDISQFEQNSEDYKSKAAKIMGLIKTFNLDCEFDFDGVIYGTCDYNAVFLTELHHIIPIKEIELGITLEFPKK